ncbi:MAG: hypothetical protein LC793_15450 [Thermomicrobia bacterium]|nr:hypothetical protein [Thermomicrobia bacterium]
MKEEIERTLILLVGMPLWGSHRAADLQVFKFGKRIPSRTRGTTRRPPMAVEIGEYGLHVQCPWRIIQGTTIAVASHDLYYAAGDDPYKNDDDFDWEVAGANRRDERIAVLFAAWADSPPVVESVVADNVCSLRISLTQQCTLDLFPADSLEREHWRLLPNSPKRNHFVVTGTGYRNVIS